MLVVPFPTSSNMTFVSLLNFITCTFAILDSHLPSRIACLMDVRSRCCGEFWKTGLAPPPPFGDLGTSIHASVRGRSITHLRSPLRSRDRSLNSVPGVPCLFMTMDDRIFEVSGSVQRDRNHILMPPSNGHNVMLEGKVYIEREEARERG